MLGDEGTIPASSRAELESCERCNEKRRELTAIVRALSEDGRVERADIAAALKMEDAPAIAPIAGIPPRVDRVGLEASKSPSHGTAVARTEPIRTNRARWLAIAAAVLVVLAGVAWVLTSDHGQAQKDFPLSGDEKFSELAVTGSLSSGLRFAWSYPRAVDTSFGLEVWNDDPGAESKKPLVDVKGFVPSEFVLKREQADQWPKDVKRIRWRVSAYASGQFETVSPLMHSPLSR